MANNDLMKWVTSEIDFYELLGITFETFTESELRRAYRKTSLRYHPDKLGKDFDPDKYELFQSAYGVLDDPELKAKYDNHRHATIQRQRANELFEGKRRQMKEDLEARERGGAGGLKRPRDDAPSELDMEMKKLAEEGRKRRAARASMMAQKEKAEAASSPRPSTPPLKSPAEQPPQTEQPIEEEDEVERLERRIREAEQAKAKRKAEKKAMKSGVFVPVDSPRVGAAKGSNIADKDTATPIKRPNIFKGLKADENSSASPRFSFSPSISTPKRKDFTATMERLKAAEKSRLEEEIRQQEAADGNA